MGRQVLLVLALATLPIGPVGGDDGAIRSEFEAVCEDLRASDQTYYGLAPMRRLEAEIRAEAIGGNAEPHRNRIARRGFLAMEYLKEGREAEAIALLEEALDIGRRFGLTEEEEATLLFNLGLAHLRAAERANCVDDHRARSCILPITEENRHRVPEPSRAAMRAFRDYMRLSRSDALGAWLLNLAAMLAGEPVEELPAAYRVRPELLTADESADRWHDVAADLGVDAFDTAGGAVMDDFDGDGLLDLVTTTSDPCGEMKAFRNDGSGGFEEVSRAWGLDSQLGGLNLVHADYDGDGWLDLLVLRGAWLQDHGRIRNSLLRNRLGAEEGRFVDVTAAAGLAEPALPTISAAFADYDLDGDLDLYVGNELDASLEPFDSQLFRNRGDGTFEEVAAAAGLLNRRHTKGVAWGDYDDDGDPDLYLSNVGVNRLMENRGDGTFVDVAEELGVGRPVWRSFATWFFDYDNDGDLDLFVTDYEASARQVAGAFFGLSSPVGQPLLYRNEGGRFVEVAGPLGLDRPLLPMGSNYGDIDGDGWLDIYLGTGDPDFSSVVPNVMYRNVGGRRFEDVTLSRGFAHLQKGHGVAFGDLDNDGDQDMFHQLGGFFLSDAYWNALFENPGSGSRWLTLRPRGAGGNRFALGARIEVVVREAGAERSIHRLVGSGGSFGGSSLQEEIGLGGAETLVRVVVDWPSGGRQEFTGLELDAVYRLSEGRVEAERIEVEPIELGGAAGGG